MHVLSILSEPATGTARVVKRTTQLTFILCGLHAEHVLVLGCTCNMSENLNVSPAIMQETRLDAAMERQAKRATTTAAWRDARQAIATRQRPAAEPSRPLGSPAPVGSGWTPTGRPAAGFSVSTEASSWPGNRIKLPGLRNPGEGYPWYKPSPKSLGIGLLVSSRGICRAPPSPEERPAASVHPWTPE
jgi:hypothetical protein